MAKELKSALAKVAAHPGGRPGQDDAEKALTLDEADALLAEGYRQCAECGRWLDVPDAIIYHTHVLCVDDFNTRSGRTVKKRGAQG